MSENEGDNTPETVAVPKQQYDEMVEKLANSTQATSNLVLEIKELRSKNQITEAEATELKKKLAERNEGGTPQDLNTDTVTTLATEAARKILSERDEEDSKQNKELALKAFLEKHKEFHPENDEGGLKLSSLERKLSRFNQFGLKSVEDFSSVLEDAFNLTIGMSQTPKEEGSDPNPLSPIGGGNGSEIRESSDKTLTPKEMKIVDSTFGGDKERYLKIKEKRPDYVATLLQYSQ